MVLRLMESIQISVVSIVPFNIVVDA